MTYLEALNQATKELENSPSTSPALDAEVLLCFIMGFTKENFVSNRRVPMDEASQKKLSTLLKERITGVPIAYLIGQKEFFGLKFEVNKHVLIPRPETETLVDKMVFELKGKHNLRILDIGTGSGCIIISLAKTLSNNNHYFGSDDSQRALAVAEENALRHKVKVKFMRSDLTRTTGTDYDVIVANLPYLPDLTDDSTRFEPKNALVAADKGLVLYQKLFSELGSSPHKPIIYLEFGHDQAEPMKQIIGENMPDASTEIFKDLYGVPRFIRVWRKNR